MACLSASTVVDPSTANSRVLSAVESTRTRRSGQGGARRSESDMSSLALVCGCGRHRGTGGRAIGMRAYVRAGRSAVVRASPGACSHRERCRPLWRRAFQIRGVRRRCGILFPVWAIGLCWACTCLYGARGQKILILDLSAPGRQSDGLGGPQHQAVVDERLEPRTSSHPALVQARHTEEAVRGAADVHSARRSHLMGSVGHTCSELTKDGAGLTATGATSPARTGPKELRSML
eukprot:scaffold4241_cov145-Isochrysis_galbana.AAC.2